MSRPAVYLLLIGSFGCTTAQSTQGVPAMDNTLINIIGQSQVVVVAQVTGTEPITVQDDEYVRTATEAHEVLKGAVKRGQSVTVDVPSAGKETPQLDSGALFVFFLRPGESAPSATVWHLVDLSAPLPVPAERRDDFLRCARENVKIADSAPAEEALKRHVLRMLDSRLAFYQTDAARVAIGVDHWSDAEIDRLVQIITGEGDRDPLSGNPRDNLAAVVGSKGSPDRVIAFARPQLKAGQSDAVYYGLVRRQDPAVDSILWSLLKDSDPDVRISALRVAGLLRRGDVLDAFEKQHALDESDRLRQALVSARALVERD